MSKAGKNRASPKLAALTGGALDALLPRPKDEDGTAAPPALPTRRERLAAAAEAFALLRSKLKDAGTPDELRVKIATTLVGFATLPSSGWARMPGEEPAKGGAYASWDHPFAAVEADEGQAAGRPFR